MNHAVGTFDVKMKPETLSEAAAKTSIARMSMDKVYHGQLAAVSRGEFLATGGPQTGSGGYVAMERVTGTLDGKVGSFALMHSGLMTQLGTELDVRIVPGSGTGDLAGINGTLKIIIAEGQHSYELDYTLAL